MAIRKHIYELNDFPQSRNKLLFQADDTCAEIRNKGKGETNSALPPIKTYSLQQFATLQQPVTHDIVL